MHYADNYSDLVYVMRVSIQSLKSARRRSTRAPRGRSGTSLDLGIILVIDSLDHAVISSQAIASDLCSCPGGCCPLVLEHQVDVMMQGCDHRPWCACDCLSVGVVV